MTKVRGRVLASCLTLVLAVLAVNGAAGGQESLQEPAALITPEAFRADFITFLDAYGEVAGQLGDHARQRQLADARRQMQELTAEQIHQTFRGNFPDLRQLLSATEALQTHVARGLAVGERRQPQLSTLPGQPAILGACNVIPHDALTTFILLGVQQAADVILAAAGRACEQVVVAAGFGGNSSLVCLVFEIALTAAKVPFELADFCGGEENSSLLQGNFDRLGHLHSDLETEAQSIRAKGDTNTASIVANDNSNTTTVLNHISASTLQIINNSNSNAGNILNTIGAHALLAEARQIEDNLAQESCPAWMSTPEFADAAQTVRLGGRLEKVVEVIRRVIDNAGALQSVHRFELACAKHSLDEAVEKAGRRPPFRAGRVCDLLLDAYEKATSRGKDHHHGHSDHDGHWGNR